MVQKLCSLERRKIHVRGTHLYSEHWYLVISLQAVVFSFLELLLLQSIFNTLQLCQKAPLKFGCRIGSIKLSSSCVINVFQICWMKFLKALSLFVHIHFFLSVQNFCFYRQGCNSVHSYCPEQSLTHRWCCLFALWQQTQLLIFANITSISSIL